MAGPFGTFDELFLKATRSCPYPYQSRLADEGLPELLAVETGAGKTAAVVLAWLWRRRFHPDEPVRRATPHWLVLCEPMRTLTEQVEAMVTASLQRVDPAGEVLVHVVMGGRDEGQRQWRLHPEQDAVVIGTVDMLLSRGLNRGYGASRFSWPIDFGLLNNGTHWVFDEVQLLGPALPTGRQLQGLRSTLGTALHTSSTWMSATVDVAALSTVDNPYHGGPGVEVRLGAKDRAHRELAMRLEAIRTIRRVDCAGKNRSTAIARAAIEMHRDGTLTLVVVNRVRTAQEVYAALKSLGVAPSLQLLHGRFRPADRQSVAAAALDTDTDPNGPGRIVVSTQVVEAGVDISATTLLTEVAPWPSIVQRAGRCNRDGMAVGAVLAWIPVEPKESAPYEQDDVEAAMAELSSMEGDELTFTALGDRTVPVSRSLQPVLRRADVLGLFDTAPDVSGNDIDVGPFIRDDDERDVFVAWRHLDGPPGEGTRLAPGELCNVPLSRELIAFLQRHAWRFDHLERRGAAWVRFGDGEVARPGEILLVPSSSGAYDPEVGWTLKITSAVPPVDLQDPSGGDPDDNTTQVHGDEMSSRGPEWIALRRHLEEVETAVRELSDALAPLGVTPAHLEAAAVAGRLHDIGKAHPVFQESLLRMANGPDKDWVERGAPWAKSGADGVLRHSRRAFRHELVSALALLGDGGVLLRGVGSPELVTYLVAAHHGRVRLGVRSVPGADGDRYVLGVAEGEELPSVDVPGGEMPRARLSIESVRMGRSPVDGSPSWCERALDLLDQLGPFRLAFLEALVRLADWRASAFRGGSASLGSRAASSAASR